MTVSGHRLTVDDGWTVATLKAHVDALIAARDVGLDERQRAQQTAIDAASAVLNARLESMNEFRSTLSDQAAGMMPRAEALALVESVAARLAATVETWAVQHRALESRYDQGHAALATEITRLASRQDTRDGKSAGLSATGQIVLGAFTGLLSITSIVILILHISGAK